MTSRETSRYLGISLLATGVLIGYSIARVQPVTPVSASESSSNTVSPANVPVVRGRPWPNAFTHQG